MGEKTNREYTLEYKQQAVELAKEIGITRAADKLGINMANFQLWKSKAEENRTTKKLSRL